MRLTLLLWLLLALMPAAVCAAPSIAPPQRPPRIAAGNAVRPPAVTPQMKRYSETRYALYFFGTAYGLLVLWGVLASGLSARLRDLAEKAARPWFLALPLYYVLLTLVLIIIHAPLTFYSGYWLEHAYGLSRQGLGGWLGDEAKGALVDLATTLLGLWVLLWLIRRSPRRWALWFWGALIPLIAFGIFLAPLIVDPLFNKFTPMPPGPLRSRIEALAARAGIPNAPIYVVDKSKQTKTTNAYVTGIGSSARIVLWDTTLQRMPPDQVLGVVGHEMGHYVLGHLYWGFAEAVGLLLILLPLAQKFVEALLARNGRRWHLRGLTDVAALPVLLLTLSAFSFFLAPVTNALSRQMEHAADAYGLRITGDRLAMARGFVSLSEQNLSDPSPPPFVKFWLFSHPTLQERIDFALGK